MNTIRFVEIHEEEIQPAFVELDIEIADMIL